MARGLTDVAVLIFLLELLFPIGTQATSMPTAVTSATTTGAQIQRISTTNSVANSINISTGTSELATTSSGTTTTTPNQTTVTAKNATALRQTTTGISNARQTSTLMGTTRTTTWVNRTTTNVQASTTVVTATVAVAETTVGETNMSATTMATTTLSMPTTKMRAIAKSTAMTTLALQHTTTTSRHNMSTSAAAATNMTTSMGVGTVSSGISGLQTETSTPTERFMAPIKTTTSRNTTTTVTTQSATTSNAIMTQTFTTASRNTLACDVSVTSTAVRRIGALDAASAPTQTNCPANMNAMDTCQAICSGGLNATGYIRCFNGQLNDVSICVGLASSDFKIDTVWKVFSTIRVSIDGKPSRVHLIRAISKALQVDASTVSMEWKLIDRRLMFRTGTRRLASMLHEIKYEVAVLTGSLGEAVEAVMARARDLTSTGSSAFLTFSSSMLVAGLLVEKIVEVYPPVSHQSMVVLDDVGKVVAISIAATNDPSTLQPSATKSQEIGVGAVVGSIIGGVIGVMLMLASIYYWLLMRRKADA